MTAGLDLALAMVEKDPRADVARSVAHNLVMHQHRSGGQSQHSEILELAPKSDRIQNALDLACAVVSSDGARVGDIGSLPEAASHDDKPKRVVSWVHIAGIA